MILRVRNTGLEVVSIGNRRYRLIKPITIDLITTHGNMRFSVLAGFVTDFRSGGPLVDPIIDQLGNYDMQLAYLVHDICYTPCSRLDGEHPVSRKLADDLLDCMLKRAGMGKFRRFLVNRSVRWFGSSAYENDDQHTAFNTHLFKFEWLDK